MRILIDILHPAHVHFFKFFIEKMKSKGHEIIITSREKDITNHLLDELQINYVSISAIKKGIFRLGLEFLRRTIRFYRLARKYKPDIMLGIMGPTISIIGKILKIPTFVFYDTESAKITNRFVYPLATKIITPVCYNKDFGKKHVKYRGFQELAYLHPNYFKPNQDVLKLLNLNAKDTFFVIRLVSWGASHDIGYKGLIDKKITKLIDKLETYGRVLITSESGTIDDKYKLDIPVHKMHDLLFYSSMYIGEGATMASEAAILGTPSIFVSPFAKKIGYLNYLEKEYDLLYNYEKIEDAINQITEIFSSEISANEKWNIKRFNMLEDTIDVTQFIIDLVENYLVNDL